MTSQQTTFQKKTKSKVPYIPGSRPSIQNAQLLISSGVPSFDYVIGGGVPVGTAVLVEEDKYGTYAKLLIKYFLAEGIVSGHSLIVASQDSDCETLVHELPAPIHQDDFVPTSDPDDKMTIAWRYQNMRVVQSSMSSTSFGHHYDLMKPMDAHRLNAADIFYWTGSVGCVQTKGWFRNPAYYDLLCTVQHKIDEGQFGVEASPEKRNILRIAVHSIGSPLWLEQAEGSSHQKSDLAIFLCFLRSLLRSAYTVCMLTMPSHLFQEISVIKRCEHLCDMSVRLESFAGSEKETSTVYKDYHGLFHINKLPAINTLTSHAPESFDLAFKLRRKKFVIEKLHLPPELKETTQREQDDFPSAGTVGCGGGRGILSGLALVVLGAVLLTDVPRVLLSRLLGSNHMSSQPLFYYIALGLMGVGLMVCATCVLGFWAVYLDTHCLLALLLFLLVVLLLSESSLGVLAVICPEYLGVTVTKTQLAESLQRTYGVPGKEQFTAAIDLAQTIFQCCGISGAADYDVSWWRLRELGQADLFVPRSCCFLSDAADDSKAFLDPHPLNMSLCQSVDQGLYQMARHTEGCFLQLEGWFRYHTTLFLAIGSGLVLVELSVLLSAILVCLQLPKDQTYTSESHDPGFKSA